MSLGKKRLLGMFLLAVLFLSFFMLGFNFAQQATQEKQEEKARVNDDPEKIIPSPQDIKEATGIYVFVAWMWVAILVLIYILKLKIKEVDRLLSLQYFPTKKK